MVQRNAVSLNILQKAGSTKAPFGSEMDCAKISRRMIHEYIRRATALNAAIVQKDRQSRVAFQIARRNCLYRKATEVNDLRTGLAVLKELAKIQGLYPTATQTNRDGNLECSLAERDGAG